MGTKESILRCGIFPLTHRQLKRIKITGKRKQLSRYIHINSSLNFRRKEV